MDMTNNIDYDELTIQVVAQCYRDLIDMAKNYERFKGVPHYNLPNCCAIYPAFYCRRNDCEDSVVFKKRLMLYFKDKALEIVNNNLIEMCCNNYDLVRDTVYKYIKDNNQVFYNDILKPILEERKTNEKY